LSASGETTGAGNAEPLVSVIIPCWNGENFVGAAIESALGQTYPNVEVIVIDDGSTDDSLNIIRSFDARVHWESGPNRGACAARNRGLALARGTFVQFLDADDILFPQKLSSMVPLALSGGPGTVPTCDWETVTSAKDSHAVLRHLGYDGEDPVVYYLQKRQQTSSPLHWRADLEAVGGFRPELPCCQEVDLHLRLAALGTRFSYLPEVLYRKIERPDSISSNYVRVLDQYKDIFLRVRDLLVKRGALTDERRYAIAKALALGARHYVRRGLLEKADDYFRTAAGIDATGSRHAFGRWYSRALADIVGPVLAERSIQTAVWQIGYVSLRPRVAGPVLTERIVNAMRAALRKPHS